jgi:poly(3-hydroxybutyrate) depolymerase
MTCPRRLLALSLLLVTLAPALAFAADWPPQLDGRNPTTRASDGRTIERYVHGPREAWGYPTTNPSDWAYPPAQESGAAGQNHQSFYLVAPKTPRPGAPLCVVLHSANRTAYDYMAYQHLNRKIGNGDDPATVATRSPDDFYALYLSSTNAEWYGWSAVRKDRKFASTPTPAERRLFESIEWVVTKYDIDRNRIYLCGVSMGGCGTLALGMPHGDVFAAIRAQVPAGTEYAASRMGGFPAAPAADAAPAARDQWIRNISGAGLPDPPVIVDFSAQNDNWSKTQPALLQAAQAGHLPLVLAWGPFHHSTFTSAAARFPLCDVVLAYPWFEIRRNEAYPVFTNASSDQRSPWLGNPGNFDESGQLNAWFRWKNQSDTSSAFSMQLWLAHPAVDNPPASMPGESTADVTFRRLQQFKVASGVSYTWQWVRDGKLIASGKITPDAANLLTIPRLTVTTTPAELSVVPER